MFIKSASSTVVEHDCKGGGGKAAEFYFSQRQLPQRVRQIHDMGLKELNG